MRAFGNSEALREEADQVERVAIIGGSYIGTEVAASSLTAAHGDKCSIVMLEDVTLERQFGKEIGGYFQGVLQEHGVDVHGGEEIDHFEGSGGRVEKVVTKSGLEVECHLVVVGVGVTPDVTLAKGAGLEIGEAGGVLCSSQLESSVPGIFTAGDICEYDSPIQRRPMRIEHWDVAFNQGKTAGLNMLGRGIEHDVVPYFYSTWRTGRRWSTSGLAPATWSCAARSTLTTSPRSSSTTAEWWRRSRSAARTTLTSPGA